MNMSRIHRRRGIKGAAWATVWAVLLLGLLACGEAGAPTVINTCRNYLDDGLWDDAIANCPTDTDEGKSLSGQARMGRAGVSLLDLLDGLGTSTLSGEALIFDLFTVVVGSAGFTDVEDAVNLFLAISNDATTGDSNRTDSDNFNLVIASDVLLMSLLKEHLALSIDPITGAFVVPGVTDTGIDTINSVSPATTIQTVFNNIYTSPGSYYITPPLGWVRAGTKDLSRISNFVAANAAGANALGEGGLSTDPAFASLAPLDFAAKIDNGTCGATEAAAVLGFPRRLNTSHPTAVYLADELQFIDGVGGEWQGTFPLPSALVNPDHFQTNCGGGLGFNAFSVCMGVQRLLATFTGCIEPDGVTALTCGTGQHFPVLDVDGAAGADPAAVGTNAKTKLKAVLDAAWPINNAVTAPTGEFPAYACGAGDNLVHYREYDAYLRTLGQ